MATGKTSQTVPPVTRKPLHLLPKFTSERWAEGMYDMENQITSTSLFIGEDDLLTFNQKLEVETRSLIFEYQLKYADIEYELLKKEFQEIEERLNQQEASDAQPEEHVFAKPTAPADKPSKKPAKSGKNRTTSQSSSETDDKVASADEQALSDDQATKKGRGRPKRGEKVKKSGSDTEEKGASADEPVSEKTSVKRTTRKQTRSKSGSEELTSSQEAEEPSRPRRKRN